MFSTATINRLCRRATREAIRGKVKPLVYQERLAAAWTERLPIPFIGDYVPTGFRKVDHFQIDNRGEYDGISLGKAETIARLQPGDAYAIIEQGPFQSVIGEFVGPEGGTQ